MSRRSRGLSRALRAAPEGWPNRATHPARHAHQEGAAPRRHDPRDPSNASTAHPEPQQTSSSTAFVCRPGFPARLLSRYARPQMHETRLWPDTTPVPSRAPLRGCSIPHLLAVRDTGHGRAASGARLQDQDLVIRARSSSPGAPTRQAPASNFIQARSAKHHGTCCRYRGEPRTSSPGWFIGRILVGDSSPVFRPVRRRHALRQRLEADKRFRDRGSRSRTGDCRPARSTGTSLLGVAAAG